MAIQTKWTADINDWQKKLDKQRDEVERLKTKIAELTTGSKKGADETSRMGRAAAKALKDAQTPAERYKARLEEIEKMAKKAGWTEQQTGQVRAKAYRDYQAGIERAKRAHGGMNSTIGVGIDKLKMMVTGLVGAGGVMSAVNLIRGAYQKWREELKQLGDESTDLYENMITTITEAGDLAQAPQIQRMLETTPGVIRREAHDIYTGIKGAAPYLQAAEIEPLLKAAAPVAKLKGGKDLKQYGEVVGMLEAMMPEKAAADLADMALMLQERAGNEISSLTSKSSQQMIAVAREAGLEAERSLAFVLTAMKGARGVGGMRGTSIASLLQYASAPEAELLEKAGKATGPEAAGLERFAKATIQERLQQLMAPGGEAIARGVLGTESLKFRAIMKPEAIEATYAALKGVEREDFIAREIERARAMPEFREQELARRIAVQADIQKRKDEPKGRALRRREEILEAQLFGEGAVSRYTTKGVFKVAEALADLPMFKAVGTDSLGLAHAIDVGFRKGPIPGLAGRPLLGMTGLGQMGQLIGESPISEKTVTGYLEEERKALADLQQTARKQLAVSEKQLEEMRQQAPQQAREPAPKRLVTRIDPEPALSW